MDIFGIQARGSQKEEAAGSSPVCPVSSTPTQAHLYHRSAKYSKIDLNKFFFVDMDLQSYYPDPVNKFFLKKYDG